MAKRITQSPMVALTIVSGILGFPLAYYACVCVYGPNVESLAWCSIFYAVSMFAGAMLGAFLEMYFNRRSRPFKIGASFISITAVSYTHLTLPTKA